MCFLEIFISEGFKEHENSLFSTSGHNVRMHHKATRVEFASIKHVSSVWEMPRKICEGVQSYMTLR